MKRFRQIAALALAIQMLACGRGASEDGPGTTRTVTGANGVVSEGNGQAGVYTGSGLILTP